MDKLSQEDIDAKLADFPEWALSADTMQRTVSFKDFREAMAWVNRVADLAEDHQHHPDIMIRYNKVTLTLSTHDAGGVTDKDFQLAGAIDGLVAQS
jgi:4a-hydroxytetrahydrobiopterin dehydratase